MDRQRRDRNRSRSRSPSSEGSAPSHDKHRRVDNKERLERERRERMARIRAEIEEEEKRMSLLSRGSNQFANGEYGSHRSTTATPQKNLSAKETIVSVNEEELEGLDEEEQMQKLLGFGGFESTKGRAVEDNQKSLAKGAAAKHKARKYRQYMNRKGGFNRPLDKID